ncbi:unnamed protein product [Medioppia subpectinata]|uniref:Uncharacterized protein n=1 Tax=Medioppia subpectinata TaxID=1979941 RepID=A0A7R9L951_9ACAR|nr:unnamed protein product [Medioppia subpectinata]CAG2116503.1 unnamed protein product [Medioppia subpectinata]
MFVRSVMGNRQGGGGYDVRDIDQTDPQESTGLLTQTPQQPQEYSVNTIPVVCAQPSSNVTDYELAVDRGGGHHWCRCCDPHSCHMCCNGVNCGAGCADCGQCCATCCLICCDGCIRGCLEGAFR